MKKALLFLITAILILTFVSCSKGEKAEKRDYFEEGHDAFWICDYDAAIENFTLSIEESPEALAYMKRGESYLAKGDEESLPLAKADFEKALELDGTLDHAKKCLAYITYLEGDSDSARDMILNMEATNEADDTLFFVSDKYCHECSSFEHLEHPAVWLDDMSDEELLEIARAYVGRYYNCREGAMLWGPQFVDGKIEINEYYTPYEIEYESGYLMLPIGFYGEEGSKPCIIKYNLCYEDFDNWNNWKFETDTFKAKGDYEGDFGRYLHDLEYGGSFEGRLYDVEGNDVTDLFDKSMMMWQGVKATNYKSSFNLKNSFWKFCSNKLVPELESIVDWDLGEGYLANVDGSLYCSATTPPMGPLFSSNNVDVNSATLVSREESSFVVHFDHGPVDIVATAKESVWTIGEENGRLVLLDFEETHISEEEKRRMEAEFWGYCPECGSEDHYEHPTDTGDSELIKTANELVSLYYSFTWDDFSYPKEWGVKEEEGYFTVGDYIAKYVSYEGELDDYWHIQTDTFKADRPLGENPVLRYENVIDCGWCAKSYEGRLYDITGKDITDVFVESETPVRVYKATNLSADELHKTFRASFTGKALDDVERAVGWWVTEFNGDLYRAPYLGAKGYAWVEIIYESAEIIAYDENSFTVRYNHNCVEPVFMKESTWHFVIENGRILLNDLEEVYDY